MNELSEEVGIAFEWYIMLSIKHGLIDWATLLMTATVIHSARGAQGTPLVLIKVGKAYMKLRRFRNRLLCSPTQTIMTTWPQNTLSHIRSQLTPNDKKSNLKRYLNILNILFSLLILIGL